MDTFLDKLCSKALDFTYLVMIDPTYFFGLTVLSAATQNINSFQSEITLGLEKKTSDIFIVTSQQYLFWLSKPQGFLSGVEVNLLDVILVVLLAKMFKD